MRGRLRRQPDLRCIEASNEVGYVGMEPCDHVHRNLDDSIAKRWLDGEIALHAHLRVRSCLGESHSQDFCLAKLVFH